MGKVAVTQEDKARGSALLQAITELDNPTEIGALVTRILSAHRIATAEACARIAEEHRASATVPPFWYDEACDDIATDIRLQQGSEKP